MAYKNQIISILILPKPSSPMMTPSENQISFIINFSHLSNILDRFRKGFKPLEQGNLVKLSSLIVGEGRTLTPIFDENCIRLNSNFVAIERDEASYIALWSPSISVTIVPSGLIPTSASPSDATRSLSTRRTETLSSSPFKLDSCHSAVEGR